MKVFIQQQGTGLYLQLPGRWVREQAQAPVFPGSLQALDFCQKAGLREVQIRLTFGDPNFDLILRPFAPPPSSKPQIERAVSPAKDAGDLEPIPTWKAPG